MSVVAYLRVRDGVVIKGKVLATVPPKTSLFAAWPQHLFRRWVKDVASVHTRYVFYSDDGSYYAPNVGNVTEEAPAGDPPLKSKGDIDLRIDPAAILIRDKGWKSLTAVAEQTKLTHAHVSRVQELLRARGDI